MSVEQTDCGDERHATGGETAPARHVGSMRPRVEVIVLCLALLPLLVDLVVGLAMGAWVNAHGDVALMELGVLDAARGERLWGPYSRFGWHHPGPLVFYLLAPLYTLAGYASEAVSAGGILIALAAGAGLIRDLGRTVRSPRGRLVAAVLFAIVLVFPLGPERLRGPAWNPVVAAIPLAWLAVLAGRLARGDGRALPWLIGVHALVTQTHLGFFPVATALAGAGIVYGRGAITKRTWRIGLCVLALTWALSFVECLVADVPNPFMLAGFYFKMRLPSPPIGQVLGMALAPIGGPIGGLCLVAATVWAARTSVLARVALIGLGGALVALLGVRGRAMPYLFIWMVPLAWWAWVTVAARLLGEGLATRRGVGIAAALLIALGVWEVRPSFAAGEYESVRMAWEARKLTAAANYVGPLLDRPDGPALDLEDRHVLKITASLALRMAKAGWRPAFVRRWRSVLGEGFREAAEDQKRIVVVRAPREGLRTLFESPRLVLATAVPEGQGIYAAGVEPYVRWPESTVGVRVVETADLISSDAGLLDGHVVPVGARWDGSRSVFLGPEGRIVLEFDAPGAVGIRLSARATDRWEAVGLGVLEATEGDGIREGEIRWADPVRRVELRPSGSARPHALSEVAPLVMVP